MTDPFATPEEDRSPVRRLRGRLVAPVTLWTAPGPAGLTVSSMLVADGEPGRVLGLVDGESDLFEAARAAGRFLICPLTAGDQPVADRFAGLAPAPGGWFAQDQWEQTEYGPVLAGDRTWAGCMVTSTRGYGWGMLVEGTIARIRLSSGPADHSGADATADHHPLVHHRGRYRRLGK